MRLRPDQCITTETLAGEPQPCVEKFKGAQHNQDGSVRLCCRELMNNED